VRGDVAMTGEITLRGRVLPIGGLKEKALAARRLGIQKVIIPKANEREIVDLPEVLKKDVRFYPVEKIDEVFALAIEQCATVKAQPPSQTPKKGKKAVPVLSENTVRQDGVRC